MKRCLALLLAALLLRRPLPELERAMTAARLAGEAVSILGCRTPFPLAGALRFDSAEVRLPAEKDPSRAGEALVLLRASTGERRCFALRPAAPGLPARLSPRFAPPYGSRQGWVRVSKAGLFSFFLLRRG